MKMYLKQIFKLEFVTNLIPRLVEYLYFFSLSISWATEMLFTSPTPAIRKFYHVFWIKIIASLELVYLVKWTFRISSPTLPQPHRSYNLVHLLLFHFYERWIFNDGIQLEFIRDPWFGFALWIKVSGKSKYILDCSFS